MIRIIYQSKLLQNSFVQIQNYSQARYFNFLLSLLYINRKIMKSSKIVPKDQTTQFIETITNQLNNFFNKISNKAYSFECIHTPNHVDDKTIELKKAYRHFKKFLINEKLIDPELGQKARERFASKVWDQLNESQKLKYFTTKHFPPIHYIQKIVAHVSNNRKSKAKAVSSSKLIQSKLPQQHAGTPANNKSQNQGQNKKNDKKAQHPQGNVVVIE